MLWRNYLEYIDHQALRGFLFALYISFSYFEYLNYLLDITNKTSHNDITQSKRRLELSKPATSFLFLGELNPLESVIIENVKRTKVRDAIPRIS